MASQTTSAQFFNLARPPSPEKDGSLALGFHYTIPIYVIMAYF